MMAQNRLRPGLFKVFFTAAILFVGLQFLDFDWNVMNLHLLEGAPKLDFQFAQSVVKFYDLNDKVNKTVKKPTSESPLRKTDCDLRAIVITYNRAKSTVRLLESLEAADYMGDKACVEVWIDRSKTGVIHEETYKSAKSFNFTKGHLNVFPQEKHVGIYGQWIHTWQPKPDTKEIAVILEDDLSVSPLFWKYLKMIHARYDHKPEINGYCLMGYTMKHAGGGDVIVSSEHLVYKYPIVGSWGFSPRRDNWIGFQKWFDVAYQNISFEPLVPGILPSVWYKQLNRAGKRDSMWTMWHIWYAYSKKEWSLYINLPGRKGFSINWRENGLHFSGKARTKADPMVTEWIPGLDKLPDEPIHINVHGKVVS